jgi:hypothetical protein
MATSRSNDEAPERSAEDAEAPAYPDDKADWEVRVAAPPSPLDLGASQRITLGTAFLLAAPVSLPARPRRSNAA